MFQHRIRFSGKKAVARSELRVGEALIIIERDESRGEIKVMVDVDRAVKIKVEDVPADSPSRDLLQTLSLPRIRIA